MGSRAWVKRALMCWSMVRNALRTGGGVCGVVVASSGLLTATLREDDRVSVGWSWWWVVDRGWWSLPVVVCDARVRTLG